MKCAVLILLLGAFVGFSYAQTYTCTNIPADVLDKVENFRLLLKAFSAWNAYTALAYLKFPTEFLTHIWYKYTYHTVAQLYAIRVDVLKAMTIQGKPAADFTVTAFSTLMGGPAVSGAVGQLTIGNIAYCMAAL